MRYSDKRFRATTAVFDVLDYSHSTVLAPVGSDLDERFEDGSL